jgi:hypothetical protein
MNLDKSTKTRTERPDKAGFPAMLAILLLLGGIGFGVMDYGSYQYYRRHVNYVEEIRRHPETLADSSYKPEFVIAINESDAARYRLQMLWVSALMILFLSGGGLLLNRSIKTYRRTRNLEYEEIDWRTIEKPTHRIEVLSTRYQTWLGVGLVAFFGLSTVLNLAQVFGNKYETTSSVVYKTVIYLGLVLPLISFFIFTIIISKRKIIKSFDASGITRGDGQHFLWSDFLGVIPRIGNYRYGGKANWRTELVFTEQRVAWIIPQRLKNYAEVYGFVNALPHAVLKDAAQISQSKIVAE